MDWSTIIGAILIPGIGFAATMLIWVGRMSTKVETNTEEMRKQREHIHKVANNLMEFQSKVASEYVTLAAVATLRVELVQAIDRLGDRFDRLFEGRKP